MDIDYLGRILEFTLVTLQKLSSPSKEGQLKASYECLFEELTEICRPTKDKSNNPCEIALIRGLQFVMEQIQVCFILLISSSSDLLIGETKCYENNCIL